MDLAPAPFFDDVAGGPPGGAAWWVRTSDEIRIRVGAWPTGTEKSRGTVLLFPGRTEYIEKYGNTAAELAKRGFAMMAIDWRGQGLADRLLDNPRIGHIVQFSDYQKDIAAMMRAARALDLPRPYFLLSHSLGGSIGLRAVMEGLAVQACAFIGPMWGIYMAPALRPVGWITTTIAPSLGLGTRLTPKTSLDFYVLTQAFKGNVLTHDAGMYRMMQDQLSAHMELGLGGPSIVWLREALAECKTLSGRASPDIPCLTFLGSEEAIVDCNAVYERMQAWPRGTLDVVEGAHHEVLMETPAIRARVFDRLEALFTGEQDTAATG
jgi:lysophospholipase